ncbi:LysR family transcriptional regulator [Lactobacillus acidophilus]|nr:LysR family transcriptional regulator [Lactobacillus acidophilus]
MNNFNVELIKIFLAVSKFHSFSRAGNYLYLDPSTVSKKIRQLEKMLISNFSSEIIKVLS